jgi:hypothetical protein
MSYINNLKHEIYKPVLNFKKYYKGQVTSREWNNAYPFWYALFHSLDVTWNNAYQKRLENGITHTKKGTGKEHYWKYVRRKVKKRCSENRR